MKPHVLVIFSTLIACAQSSRDLLVKCEFGGSCSAICPLTTVGSRAFAFFSILGCYWDAGLSSVNSEVCIQTKRFCLHS